MKPEEQLMLALITAKHVKDHKKFLELLLAHEPSAAVDTIEKFKEVADVFGLSEQCVQDLWEAMLEAKARADGTVEGGVTFTYACAVQSIAMSLSEGKCKDCAHRPVVEDEEESSEGYTIQ